MHHQLKFCLFLLLLSTSIQAQQFKVSYTSTTFEGVFSGKVLLYLSKDSKSPKDLGTGLPTLCCFSIDVNQIKPNATVLFDDNATSYPVHLSDIERGEYYVQAVWDRNTGGRNIGNSPDNLYNEAIKIMITKDTKATFELRCDKVVAAPVFIETDFVKELKASSPLLSAFYQKAFTMNAAVLLPMEYYLEPTRTFPVLFRVSGYGGDYHHYSGKDQKSRLLGSTPCITVFLDGNCPTGHNTYTNSENNGPWGDALVNDLIPFVEKNYRCNGARVLSGHSSGGWSALWLQVNYPTTFAGCWSSSPDPVDFRNFQQVNLYVDTNMFYDANMDLRVDGSVAGYIPWIYLRDDYRMENVLYRGEQYASWNAVYGKKTSDGTPEKICDMHTGEINPSVVSHWKAYDISVLLRDHWEVLQPLIDHKIRISVGNDDNFFLNQSVELLEQEMKNLHSNFEFVYYPGDHFTIGTTAYNNEGYVFLEKKYMEWKNK